MFLFTWVELWKCLQLTGILSDLISCIGTAENSCISTISSQHNSPEIFLSNHISSGTPLLSYFLWFILLLGLFSALWLKPINWLHAGDKSFGLEESHCPDGSASQTELMGKDERSTFPSFLPPWGENIPGALQEVGVNSYENLIIMIWQAAFIAYVNNTRLMCKQNWTFWFLNQD